MEQLEPIDADQVEAEVQEDVNEDQDRDGAQDGDGAQERDKDDVIERNEVRVVLNKSCFICKTHFIRPLLKGELIAFLYLFSLDMG